MVVVVQHVPRRPGMSRSHGRTVSALSRRPPIRAAHATARTVGPVRAHDAPVFDRARETDPVPMDRAVSAARPPVHRVGASEVLPEANVTEVRPRPETHNEPAGADLFHSARAATSG
jgi:hypothetical protein